MKEYVRLFESPDSIMVDNKRFRYDDGFAFVYRDGRLAVGEFMQTHGNMIRRMFDKGEDVSWLGGYDPDKLPYPFNWGVFNSENVRGRIWPSVRVISFWRGDGKVKWDEDGTITRGADIVLDVLRKLPWSVDPLEWKFDAWSGTGDQPASGDKLVYVSSAVNTSRGGGYEAAERRFKSRIGD